MRRFSCLLVILTFSFLQACTVSVGGGRESLGKKNRTLPTAGDDVLHPVEQKNEVRPADKVSKGISIEILKIGQESDWNSFLPEYRPALKFFFTQALTTGSIDSVVKLVGASSDTSLFNPFAKLQKISLNQNDCSAIYCQDTELATRLTAQMESGRLVLLTHAWTSFRGLALDPEHTITKALIENFKGPGPHAPFPPIVITPQTELATLYHEGVHSIDFQSGLLFDFKAFLLTLVRLEKIKDGHAGVFQRYVFETRAYLAEIEFLNAGSRAEEFTMVSPTATTYSVSKMKRADYMKERLRDIEFKMEMYQSAFDKALAQSTLSEDEKELVRAKSQSLIQKSKTSLWK